MAGGALVSPFSPSLPQPNLVFVINNVRYRGILRRETISPYVLVSVSYDWCRDILKYSQHRYRRISKNIAWSVCQELLESTPNTQVFKPPTFLTYSHCQSIFRNAIIILNFLKWDQLPQSYDGKAAELSVSVESEDQASAVGVTKCRSGNHHK